MAINLTESLRRLHERIHSCCYMALDLCDYMGSPINEEKIREVYKHLSKASFILCEIEERRKGV